jgi:lipocalin
MIPKSRIADAWNRFFNIPPFKDYKVKASSEEERTAISQTVDQKKLACDYDKIAMSDKCTFYLTDGEVVCATCGKTIRV